MTPLGIVEGEVLLSLEHHGETTLRRLIQESQWPARIVMMGVGALIREGLVHGVHRDPNTVIVAKAEGSDDHLRVGLALLPAWRNPRGAEVEENEEVTNGQESDGRLDPVCAGTNWV